MTTITLDIETIGTSDPAVISEIAAGITPPGNISKAETIAVWEKEKKPALIEEAVRKTSFDGSTGRIICIGIAVNDDDPAAECGPTEGGILQIAFKAIQHAATTHFKFAGDKRDDKGITFVGHNISGFDLRFLWQRAVINGIKPPACLLNAMQAKPWDKCIADTMLMWNPEREKRISLDKLCRALGVPTSKGDMDGSKVWQAFKDGRLNDIADYCKMDVDATRTCYRKLIFAEPDLLASVA